MKQVAVISGKGGTGKTTFSATIHAIEGGVVADCDVDAPNLHILLKPQILSSEEFVATKKARILQDECSGCGLCYELCRFGAIEIDSGGRYFVDEKKCEGCAFCFNACPEKAIVMDDTKTGDIYFSKTEWGYFIHARLKPGEENTGRLVTEVKNRAKKIAEENATEYLIVDAAPGVGCPVMASLTGVDAAIIVTEPTASGLNDMMRVIDLCEHFKIKPFVVVNKYDLNIDVASEIENSCAANGIDFVGRIPFDDSIPEQMANLSFPFTGKAADKMVECWKKVKEVL
ncbi:ATP-binding protein [Archaeoglobus sp.]